MKAQRETVKLYNKINKFLISTRNNRILNCSLVLIVAFFYILRAHPYIFHPQLYAEDGQLWLSGAYNEGLKSIFLAYNGFSQLFYRLFGLLSLHLIPLPAEPFVYALTALLMFVLLTIYIFSGRTNLLSSNYQKIFVAISLCFVANAEELFFSFSNSVFYLALVGLLIIVATRSKHKSVDVLEKILFFILCFTNVFCWVYLVILLIEALWRKKRQYYFLACALIGSITQAAIYLTHLGGRPSVPLRYIFSKTTIVTLYNQIIVPSLRFGRIDINPLTGNRTELVYIVFAVILVGIITAVVFVKSNYVVRYFLLFCLVITFVSLRSPSDGINSTSQIIIVLATYHWGNRYFIYGILGMFVVWAKFSQLIFKSSFLPAMIPIFVTFTALSCVILGGFFIQRDFLPLSSEYSMGIKKFEHNKKAGITIPINPEGWYLIFNPKK